MWNKLLRNKNAAILAGSILVLYFVISVIQVYYLYEITKTEFIEDDKYHLEISVKNVEDTFASDRRKVHFLGNISAVQGIIRSTNNQNLDTKSNTSLDEWKNRLATIFYSYMQTNAQIRQIRFIGLEDNGRELVRVERSHGNIKITDEDNLQQKGNSSYFKNAIKLTPGSVFISDIELNKEHGRIDFPEWPTYRVATGTYTKDKNLFGFIIINIDATEFLAKFHSNSAGHQTYLLNSDANFILHPDPYLNFAFEHKNSLFDSWRAYFNMPIEEVPYKITKVEKPNGDILVTQGVKVKYNSQSKEHYLYIVNTISEATIKNKVFNRFISYQAVSIILLIVILTIIIIYQKSNEANRAKIDAENRYETIIGAISESIVMLNKNYQLKRYNTAAFSLFKSLSNLNNFRGVSIFDLLPNAKVDIIDAKRKLDEGESNAELQASISSPNDEIRHYSIILTKINTINTGETDLVLLIRDTTIIVEYRRSLEVTNQHLEEKVRERTSELRHALQLADKANKTKSDFLAAMSHEIRTPLNGMLGMLNLLDKEPLSARQETNLKMAKSSASILTQLINDILDFSKIEAGKLSIEAVDFNLVQLLSTTISSMEATAAGKGLQLCCDLTDVKAEYVNSDPHRIKQIINNLLSNAIKFTDTGSITLKASTNRVDDKTIELSCAVIDTGIGIEQERLDHIFDKFIQATPSTSRVYGGTGLGLSISKQLVQLLDGELTVKSEVNHGSHFSFTLPLGHTRDEIATSVESVIPDPANFLAGHTILIADDNLTNRAVIVGLLEAKNVTLLQAVDGTEVLNTLQTHKDGRVDIILMDCQMPELDGYQTTQCIRNGEAGQSYSELPIIALTAAAMSGEKDKCLAAGMTDYLTKPVEFDQLLLKLKYYIDDKKTIEISTLESKAEVDINAIWDKEGALSRLNNCQELLVSIYDIFHETSPETLTTLKTALDASDIDAIRRQAHKLKGPALTVGAVRVAQIALQLESLNEEQLQEATTNRLYKSLEEEYQLFVELVERELSE